MDCDRDREIDRLVARARRGPNPGDLRPILGMTKNNPEKRLKCLREYVEKNNLK